MLALIYLARCVCDLGRHDEIFPVEVIKEVQAGSPQTMLSRLVEFLRTRAGASYLVLRSVNHGCEERFWKRDPRG
jgi:hypothetical protein